MPELIFIFLTNPASLLYWLLQRIIIFAQDIHKHMAKIFINMDILKKSARKIEFLECFSFAMMVKMTFTSSLVKNATIRNLKSIFGIGTTKISRILKNSLQYGFIKYDNHGNLIALPLSVKKKGQYHYCFKFNHMEVNKKNPKCPYKISAIMNELRSIVLLNKIKTKDELLDQLNKLGALKDYNPKSKGGREKKSFFERMSAIKFFCGLSIGRMMDDLRCSRYAAMKAIKTLVAKKQVSKWVNRQIIYDPILNGATNSDREFEIARREYWDLYGEIIIKTKNDIFLKFPNIYHYKSEKIVLFRKSCDVGTKWNLAIRDVMHERKLERQFNNLDNITKGKKENYYDFNLAL